MVVAAARNIFPFSAVAGNVSAVARIRTAQTHWEELRALPRRSPEARLYEMMIVVAPTVGEEGLPQVVERVSGYIVTNGGSVETFNHDNPWGRRRLAYPIQNYQDAFYVLYYFELAPAAIDEIERDLRLDEQIIRHLIVKYDPMAEHSSNPSPYARMREQPEEDASEADAPPAEEGADASASTEDESTAAIDAEAAEEAGEEEDPAVANAEAEDA